MAMTRKEAIEELERLLSHWDDLEKGKRRFRWYSKAALDVAIPALRPVSREQVEKVWRGEWERIIDPCGELEGFLCKCGRQSYSADNFCPSCGMAMSDKAVGLVLERLEALKDEQ